MNIDERVKDFYELAKKHPDDANLQEALALVKSLRHSQGSLKGWNERYRLDNGALKTEITQFSQDNAFLKKELATLNQEMLQLTHEKEKIVAQRQKAIAELKHIQTEVEVAAANVKQTKSLFGKFSILWVLIKSLFLDDDFGGYGKIDDSLPPDPDKPQMNTDTASVNRSLLDK